MWLSDVKAAQMRCQGKLVGSHEAVGTCHSPNAPPKQFTSSSHLTGDPKIINPTLALDTFKNDQPIWELKSLETSDF